MCEEYLLDECCIEPNSEWPGRLIATCRSINAKLYRYNRKQKFREREKKR